MNGQLQQIFVAAQQHHQAGQFNRAEAGYRHVLSEAPNDPAATHFLGLLLFQTKRVAEGLGLLERSVAVPGVPGDFFFNYAVALDQLGRWPQAIGFYERALELRPDFPDAMVNLAAALAKFQRFEKGIELCRRALALRPGWEMARFNLAQCCKGRAMQLHFTGAPSRAIPFYREAAELRVDDDAAAAGLIVAMAQAGRVDEALSWGADALKRFTNAALVGWSFGHALERAGQRENALAQYRRALSISPVEDKPLGLIDPDQLATAVDWCRQAVGLNAGNLHALVPIAQRLAREQGAGDDAVRALERSAPVDSNATIPVWALSNRLLSLHYAMPMKPQDLFREHIRLGRLLERVAPLPARPCSNRGPHKIRVGYVSGDFWAHAVAFYFEPILANQDRKRFEIFCYANSPTVDETTRRLQSYPATWRTIAGLPDEQVAQAIRNDQIDILVDLSGHTSENRLQVFALKPAPVQVTYLGYPDTTGLTRMDFRLTDAIADPPGRADELHTERLVRLNKGGWCYRPPVMHVLPSALPARSNNFMTFGCFNNTHKLVDATFELWGRLLIAIPSSRLLLKAGGFVEPSTAQRVLEGLERVGVVRDRVDLYAQTDSLADHFAFYNRVDIALDTYPYNGTTTTCEALWMGVPVVTLAGQVHASRVGASLLSAVGLAELIAATPDEFVKIGAELAADVERLATQRGGLRARLASSGLMDGGGFTLELERHFLKMWEERCVAAGAPA